MGVRAVLGSAKRWFLDHYGTADLRTLGLFRIAFGSLLAADCVRHWRAASFAYSNDGVLSNHFHLFVSYRPSDAYHFSLFHAFSSLAEVHVLFALSLLCYLCYAVGYRTRLFAILSFVLVTSMDSRLPLVENGGYVVVNLLALWSMFMPTGARFSVDALIRASRGRPAPHAPFVSAAVACATLNVALIYYFNVVNKSGQIWRSGDTVHYVLHLDRMVTGLAVFLRETLPLWLMKPMSWGVLVIEAMLVPLILWPSARRITRPLAMLCMWVLHASFGVMMRLGPFSWFMMCWSLLLLGPPQWDVLERRFAPRLARLAERSEGLLRYFGLTPGAPRPLPPDSPLARRLARARRALREAVIVYLGLCALIQAINENKSVPAFLKHDRYVPWFVRATIVYPRIFQGWGMFSANPITDDGVLAVDAITIDGRHVDPFTGAPPDLDLTDARGAGLDQITQDYFNRIRLDRNKAYRKPQGLQEYLLRYHERTGRPEDEIVAFDVFWVRDQCPRPGEAKPYDNEAIPILSYRRPGYRPRPGLPALPPPLKEQSAGE